MSQKAKKILITVAHFSEIKDFLEALGFEGRVFKGKPVKISRFEKEISLVIVGVGYKRGLFRLNEILKNFSMPDLILNVGSAGSLAVGLNSGDCFVPDNFLHDGAGRSLETTQLLKGQYPIKVINILKDKGIKSKTGTLVTVKKPVESLEIAAKLRSLYNAFAVDMEAFYLAEAASQKNIPFTSLKIISDRADSSVQNDFKKSLPQVSKKIGNILPQLMKDI